MKAVESAFKAQKPPTPFERFQRGEIQIGLDPATATKEEYYDKIDELGMAVVGDKTFKGPSRSERRTAAAKVKAPRLWLPLRG